MYNFTLSPLERALIFSRSVQETDFLWKTVPTQSVLHALISEGFWISLAQDALYTSAGSLSVALYLLSVRHFRADTAGSG